MKKIITYWTFDILHKWHINILRRARELWDHLTVAISTDEFNLLKKKKSFYSYDERKFMLESIKYVDEVIPENNWEQKITDVQNRDVDIFVIWDDWKGHFDFLKDYCEVVYLPRTEDISTTELKRALKSISEENIEKMEDILKSMNDLKHIVFWY